MGTALWLIGPDLPAAAQDTQKDATVWTKKANQAVAADPTLRWDDKKDFDNIRKGFIGKDSPLVITDGNGRKIFDMEAYTDFIKPDAPSPDTVNPSLWRHSRLNTSAGLFKIADRLYQVRGYDIACMIVIESKAGYIVVDTLSNTEESKKAMELVYKHLGKKPVKAVVITHSHADHFGGVGGVVDAAQVKSRKVKVIAPKNFVDAALNENILAGPAMARRGVFQFGNSLPVNPKGTVDSGLGKRRASGTISFTYPTDLVTQTGQKMTIDGVQFVFQLAPESEAPAEMEFYLPQFKALCVAENVNQSSHNLYPIRGALTRDARAWAGYIDEMMEMFPNTEVAFGTHFWPVWGKGEVRNWLEKQRDLYKYMHDQSLRLANHGFTGPEIAQMMKLPSSLASEWFNRDYYGAIQNNVRAVYTRYFGWYDGNPANLFPLPPEESSKRLVELMGGPAAVLPKAREAFDAGEYRWVAQLLNYVVFADPENKEARNLEADALEQLGYQQESSIFRNAYLTAAVELRTGKPTGSLRGSVSILAAISDSALFDFLAVRLNGPKADGKTITINWVFPDSNKKYLMKLKNSVLGHSAGKESPLADLTITLDHAAFIKLMFLGESPEELSKAGGVKFAGDRSKLDELVGLLDKFDGGFHIVMP